MELGLDVPLVHVAEEPVGKVDLQEPCLVLPLRVDLEDSEIGERVIVLGNRVDNVPHFLCDLLVRETTVRKKVVRHRAALPGKRNLHRVENEPTNKG